MTRPTDEEVFPEQYLDGEKIIDLLEWKDCEEPKEKEENEEKGKAGMEGTKKSKSGNISDAQKKEQPSEGTCQEGKFIPGPMKVCMRAKPPKGNCRLNYYDYHT